MRSRALDPNVSSQEQSMGEAILAYYKNDVGAGDMTASAVLPPTQITAIIKAEGDGVLAGMLEARFLLGRLGIKVKSAKDDGSAIGKGCTVLRMEGRARKILSAERTLLNFLTRLSGIATETRRLSRKSKARIAATRKTCLNFSDKRAVQLGGGMAHRLGLFGMILIKDNHIDVVAAELGCSRVSAIGECLKRARRKSKGRQIEIEVRSIPEALAAARGKPDIIMLDGMGVSQTRRAARLLKRSGILLEASGGIKEGNISAYGNSGADFVSLGALTNACKPLDMSLEVV